MNLNSINETMFRLYGKQVDPEVFLSIVGTEGLAIHFGQSAEDAVLLRLLGLKKRGTYVDVGAFHPRIYSNTYLLYILLGWTGINIDASSEAIELLKKERPNDINVLAAVSDQGGRSKYWKFDRPARNTISDKNLERQLKKGDTALIGKEEVQLHRLDDILEEHLQPNTTIDLLNIDVEGSELNVLMSNDWEKYIPSIILIEDYSVRIDGVENSKIYQYLIDKGYSFFSHCFDTSIYVSKNFRLEKDASTKYGFDFINYSPRDEFNGLIRTVKNSERLQEEVNQITDEKIRLQEKIDQITVQKEQLQEEVEQLEVEKLRLLGETKRLKEELLSSAQLNNLIMEQISDQISGLRYRLEQHKRLLQQLETSNHKMEKEIEKKKNGLRELKRMVEFSVLLRNKEKNEYLMLKNSKSWKITRPLRKVKQILKSEG